MYNLDKRKILIIKHLINNKTFIKSETLADVIGSNSRTVRDDLKVVDRFLRNFGAEIETRVGQGYTIRFDNFEEYQTFLQVFREKYGDDSAIPSYNKERVELMLYSLLTSPYVKAESLMERLYISKSTFNADIRTVRQLLSEYHLTLEHKPGKGMQVCGEERHIRVALSDHIYDDEEDQTEEFGLLRCHLDSKWVWDQLAVGLRKEGIHVGLRSFQEIVNYIIVSEARYRSGHRLKPNEELEIEVRGLEPYEGLYSIVEQIWPHLPPQEAASLILYIQSRRIYGCEDPFPRRTHAWLYYLYNEIKSDIAKCSQFGIILDQTIEELLPRLLRSLLLRVRYGFENRTGSVIATKQKNICYEYAVLISNFISKRFACSLSDREITGLATELQDGLTVIIRNQKFAKQDICITSAMGKNACMLYGRRIQEQFANQIHSVIYREFYEIMESGNSFDVIVTDIPKGKFIVDVPIFQIKYGLNSRERKHLYALLSLKQQRLEVFLSYFHPQLYFLSLEAQTKEEVMRFAAAQIEELWQSQMQTVKKGTLLQCFYQRDQLSSSERGNNVAVCHSFLPICDYTQIAIITLRRPIVWDTELVSVVFAAALGPEKVLYDSVTNLSLLIADLDLVHQLLHAEDFLQGMRAIESSFCKNEWI